MAGRKPPRLRVVELRDGGPSDDHRPLIDLIPGRLSETLDCLDEYLAGVPDLFEFGDTVVRPAPEEVEHSAGGQPRSRPRLVSVTNENLRDISSKYVAFQKYNNRAKKRVAADCPVHVAEAFLDRDGARKLRKLRGLTSAPSLRRNGTICDAPGYDMETGVYFDPLDTKYPTIPRSPNREDALAAIDQLFGLVKSFPFDDPISQSVTLSALLTTVCRHAMIASPLFGITAPVAGAGKSKLAQTIAIVATGCPCPVTALGKKEEEAEKRLCAALIAGDQVIILDNAERPIAGELICQAVTEQYVAVRVFGLLKRIIVPNQTIFLATGNGLRFEGDLSRRTLLIGLDPKCERPELREFEDDDPVLVALRDRPSLVVAALTIVRAFALEGCPREVAPLGSFEDWSKWARDPPVWLGLPDPAEAMNKVRGDDPEGLRLTAVLEQWEQAIGERAVTSGELARLVNPALEGFCQPSLREALLMIAAVRGEVNAQKLGNWLSKIKGRQVKGKWIDQVPMLNGFKRWKLVSGGSL